MNLKDIETCLHVSLCQHIAKILYIMSTRLQKRQVLICNMFFKGNYQPTLQAKVEYATHQKYFTCTTYS